MDFKVGDIVKVKHRFNGHCFEIGELVEITNIDEYGCIDATDGTNVWSLTEDELYKMRLIRRNDYEQ